MKELYKKVIYDICAPAAIKLRHTQLQEISGKELTHRGKEPEKGLCAFL